MERHRIEVAASLDEVVSVLRATDFAGADSDGEGKGLMHLVDGVGLMRQVADDRVRISVFHHGEGADVGRVVQQLREQGLTVSHRRLDAD